MNEIVPDLIGRVTESLRGARALARDSARRHPESTWIDAYTCIDRAEAQLGLLEASRPAPGASPNVVGDRPAGDCLGLLQAAEESLSAIPAGDAAPGLVLARAYLTEAILEVSGRQP